MFFRGLLVLSVAINGLSAVVAFLSLRRRGGMAWVLQRLGLTARPATDYAGIARTRFAESLPAVGGTIVWGDSLAQNAPLLEVLADTRQWGIGGQRIGDLSTWSADVIAARPSRLVISVGINDLLVGGSPLDALDAYRELLAHLRDGLPASRIELWALPPVAELRAQVAVFNDGLRAVAGGFGAFVVDPWAGAPDGWSGDGVHPTRATYLAGLVRCSGTAPIVH